MDHLVVSLGNVYGLDHLDVFHHGKLDSLWPH
jgi:hypothetical protein